MLISCIKMITRCITEKKIYKIHTIIFIKQLCLENSSNTMYSGINSIEIMVRYLGNF